MSDMDYLFVMEDGGGWWLKIDSMEKLTDYFEHTFQGRQDPRGNSEAVLPEKESNISAIQGSGHTHIAVYGRHALLCVCGRYADKRRRNSEMEQL